MGNTMKEQEMEPCPDYKETLWLDVYGELDPNERPNWERHLEECEACREERKQLLGMIQTVKEAVPSPALSPEKAQAIASSIKRKMSNEREDVWQRKRLFGTANRLIPALATICLLIVALSWFSLQELKKPPAVQMISDLALEEQIISEDLDVIRNLELLQEMETLEKLVKFLDKKGVNNTSIQRESKINYGGAYV
jgi:predicted anti-sigma-YlaC factor YlaD